MRALRGVVVALAVALACFPLEARSSSVERLDDFNRAVHTVYDTAALVVRSAQRAFNFGQPGTVSIQATTSSIELQTDYELSPVDKQKVIDKYTVTSRATELSQLALRPGRKTDLYEVAHSGDSGDLIQYGAGIGQLLAPGLVLALFTLIGGIIYGCVRCCKGCGCCKCCACCRQKNLDLPPKRALALMIAIAVCCTVVTAFAILGIVESEKIHKDVTDPKSGMRGVALNLCQDFIDKIVNISTPIRDVRGQVDYVANEVDIIILSVNSTIVNGITSFKDALTAAANNISATTTLTVNGNPFNCTFCAELVSEVNTIKANADNTSSETLNTLRDALSNARSELINVKDKIKDGLNDVLEILQDAQDQVADAKYQVAYQTRDMAKYDDMRRQFVLVLLLIPCMFIILGGLGFIVRNIIIVGLIIMFFTWLIFAITLPMGTFIGDGCRLMNKGEPQLGKEIKGLGNNTKIIYGCMLNKYMLGADVLDQEKNLNFTEVLDLLNDPAATRPVSEYLSFPEFNSKVSQVNNLGLANTFNFPDEVIDDAIDRLNALKGWTNITRANVGTIPVSGPNETAAKNEAVNFLNISNQLQPTITNIQTQFATVNGVLTGLVASISAAQASLLNTQNILGPVFTAADALKAQAFCGFLGNRYLEFKKLMCKGVGDGAALLALASGMVSLFTLFAVFIACKMEAVEKDHAAAKELMVAPGPSDGSAIPMQPMDSGAGYAPQTSTSGGAAPMMMAPSGPRSAVVNPAPLNVPSGRSGPVRPSSVNSRSKPMSSAVDVEGGATQPSAP